MVLPLVSIITPFKNAASTLRRAIDSVLMQDYSRWELILINDNSTDTWYDELKKIRDDRIILINSHGHGVSAARNSGLDIAKGEFIMFLDADDCLTENSISSRLSFFASLPVNFVDGAVKVVSENASSTIKIWKPKFRGAVYNRMANMSSDCFFGITWMIRWNEANRKIRFNESIRIGEDWLFFLELSKLGDFYEYTDLVTYVVFQNSDTSVRNIDKYFDGLRNILFYLLQTDLLPKENIVILKRKFRSIIFKSYLKEFRLLNSLTSLFKWD